MKTSTVIKNLLILCAVLFSSQLFILTKGLHNFMAYEVTLRFHREGFLCSWRVSAGKNSFLDLALA